MCYVVGVASSGKVWCFFVFLCLSEGLSSSLFPVFFAPFSRVGNFQRHSTWADCRSFYGTVLECDTRNAEGNLTRILVQVKDRDNNGNDSNSQIPPIVTCIPVVLSLTLRGDPAGACLNPF